MQRLGGKLPLHRPVLNGNDLICHIFKVMHPFNCHRTKNRRPQEKKTRSQDYNSKPSNSQRNKKRSRRHQFTLTHGFYAAMGGFTCFDLDKDGKIGRRRMKFTSAGVRFLMEHEPDLIPDLSLTSITDRSNSSSMGKALLFVQVGWFCLNSASRLGECLPLSLLEVSTLAHGLCTLASYAAWWYKLLNIDEPTWIRMSSERAREALALMQVLHRNGDEDYDRLLGAVQNKYFLPQHFDTQRLPLALRAAARYGLSVEDLKRADEPDFHISFYSPPKFEHLFWAEGLGRGVKDRIVTASIPIIYGLLHFLGWHALFPTTTERSLWRIATGIVTSSGVVAVMIFILKDVAKKLWHSADQRRVIFAVYSVVLYKIIPFFYMLGSMYLLFESIRQLWYLPPEAFAIASWSYYFPHPF